MCPTYESISREESCSTYETMSRTHMCDMTHSYVQSLQQATLRCSRPYVFTSAYVSHYSPCATARGSSHSNCCSSPSSCCSRPLSSQDPYLYDSALVRHDTLVKYASFIYVPHMNTRHATSRVPHMNPCPAFICVT